MSKALHRLWGSSMAQPQAMPSGLRCRAWSALGTIMVLGHPCLRNLFVVCIGDVNKLFNARIELLTRTYGLRGIDSNPRSRQGHIFFLHAALKTAPGVGRRANTQNNFDFGKTCRCPGRTLYTCSDWSVHKSEPVELDGFLVALRATGQ